jgi:hypothetical protein
MSIIPPGISVKPIVDLILQQDCPPAIIGTGCGSCQQQLPSLMWSGGYGYGIQAGPTYPSWGSSPCQLQKLQRILAMLNSLLLSLPQQWQRNLLNEVVVTFVPNQGNTEVTLLEAAIIMRWPGLVAQLLQMGASPNVSTSGVSLLAQLIEALPMDYQQGFGQDTQAIIDLLQQSGSLVPPGYPGTQGYLPNFIRGEYNPYRY